LGYNSEYWEYSNITKDVRDFHIKVTDIMRTRNSIYENIWYDGTDDNAYGRPYFKYDDDVEAFINDVHEIDAVDFDYVRNIEKIEDKAVEDMTEAELITKLTLFVRGEKFCEGMLSGALRDGTIQKILEELKRF